MILSFPSPEFDDAVAAVCHGSATQGTMCALNVLLRRDSVARDEYLMRIELHARLASEPDLFFHSANEVEGAPAFHFEARETSKKAGKGLGAGSLLRPAGDGPPGMVVQPPCGQTGSHQQRRCHVGSRRGRPLGAETPQPLRVAAPWNRAGFGSSPAWRRWSFIAARGW